MRQQCNAAAALCVIGSSVMRWPCRGLHLNTLFWDTVTRSPTHATASATTASRCGVSCALSATAAGSDEVCSTCLTGAVVVLDVCFCAQREGEEARRRDNTVQWLLLWPHNCEYRLVSWVRGVECPCCCVCVRVACGAEAGYASPSPPAGSIAA